MIRCKCLLVALALANVFGMGEETWAHYRFDEEKGEQSANLIQGRPAAQVGSPWVKGDFGGALWLDGDGKHITRIQVPSECQFGSGSFGFSLWFYPVRFDIDSKDKRRRLLNLVDGWPDQYLNLETTVQGRLAFTGGYRKADGKYGGVGLSTKSLLPALAWTHIACVFDREARKVRLYLNGKLESQGEIPAEFEGTFRNEKPITVGSGWQGSIGCVDEVKFWQGVPAEETVTAEYERTKTNYLKAPLAPDEGPMSAVQPNPPPVERLGAPLTFYVAPGGDDGADGTNPKAKGMGVGPWKSLTKAVLALQAGDTLVIRGGIYRETLELGRSGTVDKPITIRGEAGEKAEISGTDPLMGWRRESGRIYSAPMDFDMADQNQLFANGVYMLEARWPNSPVGVAFGEKPNAMLLCERARLTAGKPGEMTDEDLPGGDDFWKGATIWCGGGSVWYCWSAVVKTYDSASHTLFFEPNKSFNDWYHPRKGNEYVLMGIREALDSEGEWWYDRTNRRMHFWAPGGVDPSTMSVEAKKRVLAVALRGVSNVRLENIMVRGAGILVDAKSSHVTLRGLYGEYLGHSYANDISGTGTVSILGREIKVESCEFARSAGSLMTVRGSNNTVVNCFLHEGDYAGKWGAAVILGGRRLVFSHNTVKDSGRDILGAGLTESIVEYNDLSGAGYLTHDLGMTYGHTVDYQNTVFRYNHVHDNRAVKTGMGIYFDHVAMNVIVHNNVIWNVEHDPVRVNNPSYYNLVFHNTAWNCGKTVTFDHSRRNDLFGCRYYNNILNKEVKLPDHVALAGNLSTEDHPKVRLLDAAAGKFSLEENSPGIGAAFPIEGFGKDIGAIPFGMPPFRVGCDLKNSAPPVSWRPTDVPYMNLVRNSCFEFGLEHWEKTGEGAAKTIAGNGWGNSSGRGPAEPVGTAKGELELSGAPVAVEQTVDGLFPGTCYTLSFWARCAEGERIQVALSGFGSEDVAKDTDTVTWSRFHIDFRTGLDSRSVKISIRKISKGAGWVRADILGIPKMPAGSAWERHEIDGGASADSAAPARELPLPLPFVVKRIALAPVIDGRVDSTEWPENVMRLEQTVAREPNGKQACTVRLAHDGKTLFVALTVPVPDKAFIRRGYKWGQNDGGEICFIDPKGAAPASSFVIHGFADGRSESITDGGVAAKLAGALGKALRYASSVGEKAWHGEWAIPLSEADVGVAPGKKLAFNFCVYRSETREWILWVGSKGPAHKLESGGEIILE